MSENFYTNIILKGDNLYLRAIHNGKRITEKIKYKPTLFVPTKKKTKYKTLDGKYVHTVNKTVWPGLVGGWDGGMATLPTSAYK